MIEGLKVAGIFSDVTTDSTPEDSSQAASVQGSVAAVIQDITGEQNSPSVNPNNSYITAPNVSVVCDPLVGASDRPELVRKPMAVLLASPISDKIWANKYVDFGTLLRRSYVNDLKYNFVVQASPSADRPVISLELAQKPKCIATIDQWLTLSNLCSDLYGAVSNRRTSLNETAKNAHWHYYDENFRFWQQETLFPWDQIHWELWLL